MKVTPANKKFGKYAAGDVFELPDKTARIMIKIGKLKQADAGAQVYRTRVMQAPSPAPMVPPHPSLKQAMETIDASAEAAPYGYKADGTPRKRPGPSPAAAE